MNAGGIEIDVVKKLQLKSSDYLDTNKEKILISIIDYPHEKSMETARVFSQYYQSEGENGNKKCNKFMKNVKLINKIDTSWITTEELFDAFIEFIPFEKAFVEFIIKRFSQYKMRFFEIRKNDFFKYSSYDIEDFLRILENDDEINKIDFLRLLQLRNDCNGDSIFSHICRGGSRQKIWLDVIKRKCTSDDIMRLFRMSDVTGKTVFHMVNDETMFSSVYNQQACKRALSSFFDELDLVEFKKELKFSGEESSEEKQALMKRSRSGVEEEDIHKTKKSKEELKTRTKQ